jgi:hypothetical protein
MIVALRIAEHAALFEILNLYKAGPNTLSTETIVRHKICEF